MLTRNGRRPCAQTLRVKQKNKKSFFIFFKKRVAIFGHFGRLISAGRKNPDNIKTDMTHAMQVSDKFGGIDFEFEFNSDMQVTCNKCREDFRVTLPNGDCEQEPDNVVWNDHAVFLCSECEGGF